MYSAFYNYSIKKVDMSTLFLNAKEVLEKKVSAKLMLTLKRGKLLKNFVKFLMKKLEMFGIKEIIILKKLKENIISINLLNSLTIIVELAYSISIQWK